MNQSMGEAYDAYSTLIRTLHKSSTVLQQWGTYAADRVGEAHELAGDMPPAVKTTNMLKAAAEAHASIEAAIKQLMAATRMMKAAAAAVEDAEQRRAAAGRKLQI